MKMLSIRSILYVSSIIITYSDFMPGVLGESNCKDITNSMHYEIPNTNKTYHYVPVGVGRVDLTEQEFTQKMRKLFSVDDKELLCAVNVSGDLRTIPNITCDGAFSQELEESLKKLLTNYSDEGSQNKVLELVWNSQEGKKMLELLSNETFGNESNSKARVKEMWFMYEAETLRTLFTDVFLGYEYQEGSNVTLEETSRKESDEVPEVGIFTMELCNQTDWDGENNYNESNDFTFDPVPVSWTGNLFRQSQGILNMTKGHTRPLVKESLYLADIEVKLRNESLNSTFVVGTTFIYDFISFSMCWIYGVKLEKCIVPLPGNATKMIEIRNITVDSYRTRDYNTTFDVYINCMGFKVKEHQSN